jgi:hypothetical protein
MQAAIAEPAALAGQFDQSGFQLLVLWLRLIRNAGPCVTNPPAGRHGVRKLLSLPASP